MNGYDPVVGYLELSMAEEALAELNGMSAVKKRTERHGELLLATQMMLKLWKEAVVTAERLCDVNADECIYFIHAAFCMHETGDTEGAMDRLLSGPKGLLGEALYHYNLACYHAVLGQIGEAGHSLRKAFEIDGELRVVAREDDDLVGVKF